MSDKKMRILFIAIAVIMTVMAFANLGNRYMFIDESITAMLGRNILKFGYPKVWDGRNLVMAAINGNEFNDSLVYIKHNWFPYYVSALGQLFEDNVLNMRALFVFIGILGAVAFGVLAKRLTHNTRAAVIAFLLYSLSIPVLLYIRVIYYLSPGLTFTILTFLFYERYIDRKDSLSVWGFIIAAAFLFHTLYVFFFITMGTILSTYLIYDRDRKNLKSMITALAVITVFTLPWFIYSRLYLSKVETGWLVNMKYFSTSLLGYIWQIHTYFFPFIPLGLIYLFYLFVSLIKKEAACQTEKRPDNTPAWIDLKTLKVGSTIKAGDVHRVPFISRIKYMVLVQIILNLIVISLFGSFLNTRWLIPSIPFLYLLTGSILDYIFTKDYIVALVILPVLLFTNLFHEAPYFAIKLSHADTKYFESFVKPPVPFFSVDEGWNTEITDLEGYISGFCIPRSYFLSFLKEISGDYDDAEEGMVLFLEKYGKQDDTVYIDGFQYETVIYYTGMKVVNRLDPEQQWFPSTFKSYPNAQKYQFLTQYPLNQCDWIIEREKYNNGGNKRKRPWHDTSIFERIYINYPETFPWPEIWYHTFYTDKTQPGFYIYRNRLTTPELNMDPNDKNFFRDQ